MFCHSREDSKHCRPCISLLAACIFLQAVFRMFTTTDPMVHFLCRSNSYMGGGLAKDTDSIAPFRKASRHHFLAAGGFDRVRSSLGFPIETSDEECGMSQVFAENMCTSPVLSL